MWSFAQEAQSRLCCLVVGFLEEEAEVTLKQHLKTGVFDRFQRAVVSNAGSAFQLPPVVSNFRRRKL